MGGGTNMHIAVIQTLCITLRRNITKHSSVGDISDYDVFSGLQNAQSKPEFFQQLGGNRQGNTEIKSRDQIFSCQ